MVTLYDEHVYNIEIQATDPQVAQPEEILIPLKPHQLAALHKMCIMERCGKVYYYVPDPSVFIQDVHSRRAISIRGNFNIKSNIGIMGDIVGYGKTLTALSIIAANPITPPALPRPVMPAYIEDEDADDAEAVESDTEDDDSADEAAEADEAEDEVDADMAGPIVPAAPKAPLGSIHRQSEMVYSFNSRNYCNFTATCERNETIGGDRYIKTTLIVVPRGPVYVQWENAINSQTQLRVLALDSLPNIRKYCPPSGSPSAVVKRFFEQYDIVLIKNTALKTLMEHYETPSYLEHPIIAWERIMIDEAHDIVSKMPIFSFRFLWLISGTYPTIINRAFGSRSQMSYAIRDILTDERMNLVLIKGNSDFVRSSFTVPAPIEHTYLCSLPTNITALQPFLQANVREMINANDIKGAIREMGGTNETEDDIVNLVTREIQRDINNKQCEIVFYSGMDMPSDQKDSRINSLTHDIARLEERMKNLKDRISMLSNKTCSICYDNFNSPILLPCTHVFCGGCLLGWMRNGTNCPECRAPIESRQLIAIVREDEKLAAEELAAGGGASGSGGPAPRHILLSKEATLLKLLNDRPDGRFLVFSRVDNGFWRLARILMERQIPFSELKGSTSQMMRILERFRNGELRIILLNTYYAGSGIDISYATDLVLFHNMGLDQVQAIGRAQRVGRTEPLHIHTLLYSTEM